MSAQVTHHASSRVTRGGDASQATFAQVMTHVTRTSDIAHSNRVTRVTRSPRFHPTRARIRTGEHTNPAKRVTRHQATR